MSRTFFEPPRRRKQHKATRFYALCFGFALLAATLACYRVLGMLCMRYIDGEYISVPSFYLGVFCALGGSAALLFCVGAFREAYLAHRALHPSSARVRRIKSKRF